MEGKVRVTVIAADFGQRPVVSAPGRLYTGSTITGTDFAPVNPLNMDDIEVPAFLRYRS
jgi:hypothetical protein